MIILCSFESFFVFLQKVFQTRKDVLIKKTVARLPLSAVIPLVEEVRIINMTFNPLETHFSSSASHSHLYFSSTSFIANKEAPGAPFDVSSTL